MKVRVNKSLKHMLDDHELPEGTEIEVKHLAYDRFYTITAPLELSGITVEKADIGFIDK